MDTVSTGNSAADDPLLFLASCHPCLSEFPDYRPLTDAALAAIVNHRFTYLARALVNAANLLAPNLIVISGELFECFGDPAETLTRITRDAVGAGGNVGNFAKARAERHGRGWALGRGHVHQGPAVGGYGGRRAILIG